MTLDQLSSKLSEVGLGSGTSKRHNWLNVAEAASVQGSITPSLSLDRKGNRVDLILDRVGYDRKTLTTGFDMIHVDEAWFYLIRDKEKARMFPGEEKASSSRLQHKSPIPKVVFICSGSSFNPSRNFDVKIGVWRGSVTKEAERTTARHQRGKQYAVDVTIGSEYSQEWYEHELLLAITEKMPWLESKGVIMQQRGASPHKGKGTTEMLKRELKRDGWHIQLVTKLALSLDLISTTWDSLRP